MSASDSELEGQGVLVFAAVLTFTCYTEDPAPPSTARTRKRRHRDDAEQSASAEPLDKSAPAPPEKRLRQHTHTDARAEAAVVSGLSFSDVRQLKHVDVVHHNSQMPAVQLWQADVRAADPSTETFTLHIVNTREDISGVPPGRIFRRVRGSAAV